jgi:prepilin-type N-terminal cleavage/methylation domain-containing protein
MKAHLHKHMIVKKRQKGFTIVELLIVIVVIGILAAIVIVAFNGVQQRARDTLRKQHANELAKALMMNYATNENYINTGGDTSTGDGWINGPTSMTTTSSVLGKIREAGYLGGASIKDPNCFQLEKAGCTGYIKFTCPSPGTAQRAYILVRLEGVGAVPRPAELEDCESKAWWEAFNINYMVKAQ